MKVDDFEERVIRAEITAENIRQVRPLRATLSATFPRALILDPTLLDRPAWSQYDYHRHWIEVIRRWTDRIVFADGWQYSIGCAVEYCVGAELSLPLLDSQLEPLVPQRAADLLREALVDIEEAGLDTTASRAALGFALGMSKPKRRERLRVAEAERLKDDRLAELSLSHNVATFASFSRSEGVFCRHIVTQTFSQARPPLTLEQALSRVFAASTSGMVNVRTFISTASKGTPFVPNLRSVDEVSTLVRRFSEEGLYTIANEAIDVHDGGVSGVSLGGIAEFAPDVTPRGVEEEGAAILPTALAAEMFTVAYGAPIAIPASPGKRYEFSVHPRQVGHKRSHVCLWEVEEVGAVHLKAQPVWPNRFSRHLGDKAYGLLLAHLVGADVPETTVVSRRVAPFRFGRNTGTGEWWLRTAPKEPVPGFFTTSDKWEDPFSLIAREDPSGEIAAVLSQEGVRAEYSGASYPLDGGRHTIEGVAGHGDRFMLGRARPDQLPPNVRRDVELLLQTLSGSLGLVRTEWAHDGNKAWLLQLHHVPNTLAEGIVSPGSASSWVEFDPDDGLERLRKLVAEVREQRMGILLTSRVGLTSHVGDVVRRAGVPCRFA